MNSLDDVWTSVRDYLKEKITPVAMTTWFGESSLYKLTGNAAYIYIPSGFKKDVVQTRFTGELKAAFGELFSCEFEIHVLDEEDMKKTENAPAPAADTDELTFENFIVGNSNRFAHAAAMAVAEGQSRDYNPLFIYGDSGLGKTHLLYAIRHEVQRRHPDFNIVYLKGDDFTNELIAAIRSGEQNEFRAKYREADLFMMDDVQFIAGRESTQEEMFNTFNNLYEAGKQIVFTADRPPLDMLRLDDRLLTRFSSGVLARVEAPDYETRVAIIRNKSNQMGMVLPDDVSSFMAENMTSNIRQLEGAVKKVRAYRDLMDSDITVATVSRIIKDMYQDKTPFVPTPSIIIDETAKYYELSADDLKGPSRTKNTALARQIAMYEIRKLTNLALQDIGNIFGGRDHTTVLSSIQKIENNIASQPEFAQTIRDITANINSRV